MVARPYYWNVPQVLGLRCRECGEEYETQPTHVCEMCFGPLDVVYDYDAIRRRISRERVESGPPSIWRWRDLLPPEEDAPVVTPGEGMTPLVKADRLAAARRDRHPDRERLPVRPPPAGRPGAAGPGARRR